MRNHQIFSNGIITNHKPFRRSNRKEVLAYVLAFAGVILFVAVAFYS
jgi:hypothetical protein